MVRETISVYPDEIWKLFQRIIEDDYTPKTAKKKKSKNAGGVQSASHFTLVVSLPMEVQLQLFNKILKGEADLHNLNHDCKLIKGKYRAQKEAIDHLKCQGNIPESCFDGLKANEVLPWSVVEGLYPGLEKMCITPWVQLISELAVKHGISVEFFNRISEVVTKKTQVSFLFSLILMFLQC